MVRSRYATVRGWMGGWPRNQPAVLVVFVAAALVFALASGMHARWVPAASAVLLILLAAYFMQLRYLLSYYLVLIGSVVVSAVIRDDEIAPGVVIVLILTAALLAFFVRTREVLGVQGNTGQDMLVDLRDRLRAQSLPARMPDGVRMEVAQRSANGEGFSGDFVLASVREQAHVAQPVGGRTTDWPGALEVAVVDVSGKGQAAGTRALLLSGGLSGLMSGSRVEEFLPAANAYLLRQEWAEGFATAVHLVLDPCTGAFAVRSAGHPPPVQHQAGSGSWRVLSTSPEPALGLMVNGTYAEVRGRLGRGDALVVYTDGVVEARGRDLSYGVDRLTGQLARHVRQGYRGAAAAGVDAPRGNGDDDRTVVVVWRE
ncbi:PP2C family protein-serine/threonine phosphatase [Aquipuribacter sp. MA13-6]|uniref:PP2C family protein-serine/threonine phosphatase n=1 Tax=unclassified Aquipuribacter TaxID=2635084 RepID=UPI003EE9F42B